MPRKKGESVETRPLIVRIPVQQDDDLRTAANGLGVDVSNLVRMILVEQLPAYIERGVDARRRAEAARARVGKAGRPNGDTTKGKPEPGTPKEADRVVDV